MRKAFRDKSKLINLTRHMPELSSILDHCPVFESSKTDLTENDFLFVKNVGYALVRLHTYDFPPLDVGGSFGQRSFLNAPTEVTGILVTKRYKEKRPCMILSHGSGGNTPGEWQVARRMMHKFDLNVLILDHYTRRGIKNTVVDQLQLSIESQLIDLAEAKKFAEKLPFVDRDRILAVGISRGGTVVDRLRRKKVLKALNITPFDAYICFYPLPHAQEIRPYLASSPAFYIIGDQDDITPLSILKPYLAHLEKFGYKSELHVAEGAYHAFEYPGNWKLGILNFLYKPTSSPRVNHVVHKFAETLLKPFDVIPLHHFQILKKSCYVHDDRGFIPVDEHGRMLSSPDLKESKLPFSQLIDHVKGNISYGGRIKLSDRATKKKAYAALYGFIRKVI